MQAVPQDLYQQLGNRLEADQPEVMHSKAICDCFKAILMFRMFVGGGLKVIIIIFSPFT